METKERRFFPRTPICLKVVYERAGIFCEDYSRNISAGGLFLNTTATVPPIGAQVEISFHIPGVREALVLRAEVVRVVSEEDAAANGTDAGVGLSFLYESDDEADRVSRFVADLAKRTGSG